MRCTLAQMVSDMFSRTQDVEDILMYFINYEYLKVVKIFQLSQLMGRPCQIFSRNVYLLLFNFDTFRCPIQMSPAIGVLACIWYFVYAIESLRHPSLNDLGSWGSVLHFNGLRISIPRFIISIWLISGPNRSITVPFWRDPDNPMS